MNRRVLAALATALLLTACGGEDDGDSDDAGGEGDAAAITTIAEQLEGEMNVDHGQAECIASAMVDGIGVEAMQEGGVLDDELKLEDEANLSEADATTAADAFTDCVDPIEFAKSAMGEDATPEVIACVESGFDDEDLHTAMKASFMGDTEEAGKVLNRLFGCMFEAS